MRIKLFLPAMIALWACLAGPVRAGEAVLEPPFDRDAGFCFIIPAPEFAGQGDSASDPTASGAALLEDGKPLAMAHAPHGDIRDKGEGRYSHWGGYLYFSTSDNSDPNTNGRVYSLAGPDGEMPARPLAGPAREEMGSAWDPEANVRVARAGQELLARSGGPGERSPSVYFDTAARVEILGRGAMGEPASRDAGLEGITRHYPVDGARWGRYGDCLVYEIPAFRAYDFSSFRSDVGGIELEVEDRRRGGSPVMLVGLHSQSALVPLAPGRTMRYRVVSDMVRQQHYGLEPSSLYVVFPGVANAEDVELKSIRYLDPATPYEDAPSGDGYQLLDNELRYVAWQWAGGSFALRDVLPGGEPVLRFGIGLLPGSGPVTYRVLVEGGGEARVVFEETVREPDQWLDQSVDLSAWRGQEARLVFESESEEPAVALWSRPGVVDRARAGRLFCIFLVDASRPDAYTGAGADRDPPNPTPAVADFAARGVVFSQAWANAPHTLYSMPALLTGLLPLHTGILDSKRVPDQVLTLAERFRAHGFFTASLILNSHSGRMRGMHQGFDLVRGRVRLVEDGNRADPSREAEIMDALPGFFAVNGNLFRLLEEHAGEDVFLLIHAMDTHTPYVPEARFRSVERDAPFRELQERLNAWHASDPGGRLAPEVLEQLYLDCAAQADHYFGEFLRRLDELRPGNTVWFLSDHGEHLAGHPEQNLYFKHVSPMFQATLAIPMILRSGLLPPGKTVSAPAQSLDVAPTLLDLAGIPYDPGEMDGLSLLQPVLGPSPDPLFLERPILSQDTPDMWSVRVGNLHALNLAASQVRLYVLDKDPGELSPLAGPEANELLGRLVWALRLQPKRPVPRADALDADQEALDELRQLRYIQ